MTLIVIVIIIIIIIIIIVIVILILPCLYINPLMRLAITVVIHAFPLN